jgi:hypothetical protein
MIRLGTILWLLLVAVSGYAMFQVKYEVAQLDDELGRVKRETAQHREAMRVLGAEWSFLDQSGRLAPLAERYLGLKPIGPAQIGQLDNLPRRAELPTSTAPAAAPPVPAPPTGARLANAKPRADR